MKQPVGELLAKKVQMSEADKAPKIMEVNQYIEDQLTQYKNLADSMPDDRNPDWEALEKAFRRMVTPE